MKAMHLQSAIAMAFAIAMAGCVSAKKQHQSTSRTELGSAYLREGNGAAAVGVLEEAVQLDRRNWQAWDKLGLAYFAQGAPEKSEEAFKKGLSLAPEKAEINNNYGLILVKMDRIPEAIERFEVGSKDITYRQPALVLSNLGYALHLDGQHTKAILVLDVAIQRSPKLCQARYHRGLAREAVDRPDKALLDYKVVIEVCGKNAPGAYFYAAKLLLDSGDREGACHYLASATASNSESLVGDAAIELANAECRQ